MAAAGLKSGATVGDRYRVERVLGHGALGSAYLCRDLMEGGALVVLRTLTGRGPARGESPACGRNFLLSAGSSTRTSHSFWISAPSTGGRRRIWSGSMWRGRMCFRDPATGASSRSCITS